jgi:uncharacterized protein (TIGR00251 family)
MIFDLISTNGNNIRFYVKIIPQSSQNKVLGWNKSADESWHLKIHIKETPEKGKANNALIRFLAKILKIHQSAVTIIHGSTDRLKLLSIEGDTEDLLKKLREYK